MMAWRADWNKFARDILRARLDREQQEVLYSVQTNPRTAVASGTARGKDYVAAVAALCFMYLTPRFNSEGKLVKNTKVALTAPTGRQVDVIMMPEISRLYRASGGILPGRLMCSGIRTNHAEWFLIGFKASDETEAWSGFHAVNTMFVVTEASGISETTFNAIEGNLQGNSRLLLVFNPNITSGYAANAMTSSRFAKFRLNSLNAENVVQKKIVYPGQVDYEWVKDKVQTWCMPINPEYKNEGDGDFCFEGRWYKPNDLFRVKVLGMFPNVSDDVLIPYGWIELANERWKSMQAEGFKPENSCRLGVDIAGMGRDSTVLVPRFDNYVAGFKLFQSGGKAEHMKVAGMILQHLRNKNDMAFIDTIGEGAGVYSRLRELGHYNAISAKFSESARGLHDISGEYDFVNMRAYCYWAMRDWLDPKNGFNPALPPCDQFIEEVTDTHWSFQSDGKIFIEKKEDIKKRLKRSPDCMDALANTFYPKKIKHVMSDEELSLDFL